MKNVLLILMLFTIVSNTKLKMICEMPNPNTTNKKEYLVLPSGFAETKDRYYISDAEECKVLAYDKISHKFIQEIGRKGNGPGDLSDPFVIGVNPENDNLYVAERGNSRISVFSKKGKFIRSFLTVSTVRSIHFNNDVLITMTQDPEKGISLNYYKNDKLYKKGGGISAETKIEDKYAFGAIYGMTYSQKVGNAIYAYSKYLPFVYVYSIEGNLRNIIKLKSYVLNDIYEKNIKAKIDRSTGVINVAHTCDGMAFDEHNIYVYHNDKKSVEIYNYNGDKKADMELVVKKDEIYRFCALAGEGYVFFSPNATIQIYR